MKSDKIHLIGDAFFAFPPSFAQGASQSIEGAYELFKSFTKSISEREAKQELQNVEIKSFKSIEIIDVYLIDNVASITVKIVSEQIKFITDRNDEMVYGNREKSETIKDKWVFERDISTSNPNWKLVETDIAYD